MSTATGAVDIAPETAKLLRRALLLGASLPLYAVAETLDGKEVSGREPVIVGFADASVSDVKHSGMVRIVLKDEDGTALTWGPSLHVEWGCTVDIAFDRFWQSLLDREDLI